MMMKCFKTTTYTMIMPLAPGKVAAYLLKPNDIKDTRLSITPLLAYEFSK